MDEVQTVIECIDNAIPIPDTCSIHSVCESLLRLLDSLAEPVIPFSVYQRCLDASSYFESKQILSSLKTVNYNVFYYIISFLREYCVDGDATSERVHAICKYYL